MPVEGLRGAARFASHECVEKKGGGVAPVGLRRFKSEIRANVDDLDRPGTGAASHCSGDSLPLNCTAVSPQRRTASATSSAERVDEHADARHGRRHVGQRGGGLRDRHLPRRRREDDAERVGARRDGGGGVLGAGDPADLDARAVHAVPLVLGDRERGARLDVAGPRVGSVVRSYYSSSQSVAPAAKSKSCSSPALYAAYAARSK